jgi:hypothetical protein
LLKTLSCRAYVSSGGAMNSLISTIVAASSTPATASQRQN